jgi:CHAT domain-containing protein
VREQLAGFPLLHFATHALLDEDAPGRSSLLLAGGDELTIYELAGLDLDVDLAVLSACRTGQGEATRGDEVVGLGRALLGAGCRAAVVSLWPVDDLSTTLLMEAFYRELRDGADAAAALRTAQLELRDMTAPAAAAARERLRAQVPEGVRAVLTRPSRPAPAATPYGHPFHWAPFTVIGPTGLPPGAPGPA